MPHPQLRILFVITRFDVTGGAQVHVHDLALGLVARGHEVKVLSGTAGPLLSDLQASRMEVEVLPELRRDIALGTDVRAVSSLRRSIASFSPDLVSSHSSKAGILTRAASVRAPWKVLFTAHGWSFTSGLPTTSRLFYGAAEAIAGPLADQIITVSDYDADLARRWLPHIRRRITTVHNGVPDLPSPPSERSPRNNTVCFIGRLDAQKDQDLALRVMQRVPELEVEFVGQGPRRAGLEDRARALDVAGRAHFVGERSDVPALLERSAFFVLFSWWEGLPRSIIEAMRGSRAVVATAVGGVAEVVEHDLTGYLVAPGDASAAEVYVRRLLVDAARRDRMGAAGRLRYLEHFTLERLIDETESLHIATTSGGTGRRSPHTDPTWDPDIG